MVDRLFIQVQGRWRATGNGQHISHMGREFCEQRLSHPSIDWLNAPNRRNWQYSVSSRDQIRLPNRAALTTFGFLEITLNGVQRGEGNATISIKCNPTRTLAHLIARYGDRSDFYAHISQMSATEFFFSAEIGSIPPSLDPEGRDNYIAHRGHMRRLVGGDFLNFMPVFVEKIQDVLAMLLSATSGLHRFEGGRQLIADHDGEVVLDWMDANVPQVESFFDRYHSDAVGAVRTGGYSILNRDDRNVLRRYASQNDFERDGDCYRISLTISKTRKLVIYAKTPTRIRFEVRRFGRARYTDMVPEVSPTGRICAIVAHERDRAIASCRWRTEVGPQFDTPVTPFVGDLVLLVHHIVSACEGDSRAVRIVLTRLLADGGISLGLDATVNDRALDRLEKSGVLLQTKIRNSRQAIGRPRRYSLTENYDSLRLLLTEALSGSPS